MDNVCAIAEHTQREPPPPSVAAVYVQPTHIPGLQLTARGDQPPTTRQYHHNQHEQEEESPYVEDRVLTPTKYQSQRRERAYVREFGVQAGKCYHSFFLSGFSLHLMYV